jgi:hypothetical protein
MILHIVRKDWKLFWPLVLGVALIEWIVRIANSSIGIFRERLAPSAMMLSFLGPLSLLAVAILIVLVVQADAIPGLRQDWLVRPIRRRDLLLSKLLFVALLVQGPIFLAEVIQGLAAGFPLGQSMGAPLSRNLSMFLMFDLPVVAFAALTRNLLEAVGAALAAVVGIVICVNASYSLNPEGMLDSMGAVSWVADALRTAWGMIASAGLLSLLYFRRKTNPARWIFGAATAVWLSAALLPWQTAFAVQERFSPQPSAADSVRISFEPNAGKIRLPHQDSQPFFRGRPAQNAFVPLRFEGFGSGEVLNADRANVRLTAPDGRTFELGQGAALTIFRDGAFHQSITVPQEIWNLVKGQPARLEIDYSLTMFKPGVEHAIPAPGGNQWVPETGRCATRLNHERIWVSEDGQQQPVPGTQIEIGCLTPGYAYCLTAFRQSAPAGEITPQDFSCRLDYAPYVARLEGDSLVRLGGLVRPDVNASELNDAHVVVRVYRPAVHFTRQVMIPNLRLSDWTAK